MKKFWLVFKHEYLRHVLRKRFILGVLSVPLFVLLTVGMGFLSVVLGTDSRPVGVIDYSGVFADPLIIPDKENGPLKATGFEFYTDPAAARAALDQKQIQGFYTVEKDYLVSGAVTLTSVEALGSEASSDFIDLLRANLIKDKPTDLQARLFNQPEITIHSLTDERSTNSSNFLAILLPILAGILFIVAVNVSGGYLLQAVVEEKENRTMEIILTSVSTDQLMAGKIIGNLSIGLTQLIIWLAAAGIGALVFFRFQTGSSGLEVGGTFLSMMALTFLPAFVMIAGLMAMVGATATEAREAQQIAGLFTIPIFIPLWFLQAIIENPNSPLSIGFSLFPLTAPLTLPMRVAFSTVPTWEIVVSMVLLVAAAIGSIILASRAFRLGMLRYGKRLSFKELFLKSA